jgi:16S rRNA (cytosine967-C5)-methyltransferase
VPDLGNGPTVQLWPHRHGTDAMFLGVLRRNS